MKSFRLLAALAGLCAFAFSSVFADAKTINIATDGDDANDGSSGHPVATLARAVALASAGDTILYGDGEFEEPAVQVTIDKNLTITSQNGPTKTTFRSLHTGVVGNVTDHSGWLYLTNCPQTVISGLYFCGKKKDGSQPQIRTAIYMREDAGTVSNCVFRYLKGGVRYGDTRYETGNVYGMGPAVFMYGGTVVDCLFEENCANRNYPRGGAISMGNLGCTGTPLVDRCTFKYNWCAYIGGNNASYGGAIWQAGGSTIRNSLFYGNHSDRGILGAVGYTWYGGTRVLVNCTAVSNTCSTANQTTERTWNGAVDSLTWRNYSADVAEDTPDPGFVNAVGGDFHLAAGSSAIDSSTGASSAKGDYDLDLKPRVMGTKADKGCYEFDPNQFSLGISCQKLATFAPMQVKFWATATGGEMDDAQSYWTFDGTEPTAEHHDAAGTSVTVTLQAGSYDVRFATVAGGKSYDVQKPNMVSLIGQYVYVKKDNPKAAYPYDTWETAAADFSDAWNLPVVANQIVTVDAGTYLVRNSLTVPAGVVIRSVNGPEKTILDGSSCGQPMVNITSAGAVLSGVTVKNAKNTSSYTTGGLDIRADSLVTNCIFDTCSSLGTTAGGLYASNGRIVDCVFTNIYKKTGDYGIALELAGPAFVDRCRVIDSHFYGTTYANETAFGAISVKNGTVRNTLVTGTRYGGCTGIYVDAGGKVENCTVASNVSMTATEKSYGVYLGAASGYVTNTIVALNVDVSGAPADAGAVAGAESRFGRCCVPGGFGADTVAGDPRFLNAGARDFRLRCNSSPCVNAAVERPWMAGGKDLDGKPRVQTAPDIGCYETARAGAAIAIR